MKQMMKNIWWNIRLWLYRKLHASLIAQYTEPENFHSLLLEHSIANIGRMGKDPYFKIEEPADLYVGNIADDWNERINEKIAILEEKEKNK